MPAGKTGRRSLLPAGALFGASSLLIEVEKDLLGEAAKQAVGGWLLPIAGVTAAIALLRLAVLLMGKWRARSGGGTASAPQGGLGLVVSLPSSDRPRSGQVTAALKQAEQQHAVCKHVQRRVLTSKDVDQVMSAVAREVDDLVEQQWVAATVGPVALYLIAPLPESFALGRQLRYSARPVVLMQSARSEDRSTAFFAALELGEQLQTPLSAKETKRVESFLRLDTREFESDSSDAPVALIVELTGQQARVEEAVQAARSGESNRYELETVDPCRAAMVVTTQSGGLAEESEQFSLAVRYISQHWDRWVSERSAMVDQWLFASAPGTVVTALGQVFTHGRLRMVRHLPTTSRTSTADPGPSSA